MELDFQDKKFISSTWGGKNVVILFDHDDDDHLVKQLKYLIKDIKGESYGFRTVSVIDNKRPKTLKIKGTKLIIT